MTSINYAAVAERYIAAWNAGDPAARRTAVAAAFADGATYVDPMMTGTGHDGIEAMIGAAQGQFPGFAFRLAPGVDGFADRVRFSWELGPVGTDQTVIAGTDVCELAEDGRLRAVVGFIDRMPGGEG
ncbi:MAG TPA: nuclear transport factor 2 family protein [Thermomicrobiales bacterium]|jgi:hypothetical protein|nr:nuclear transport factor 2 family protein [Thermomicrobiales bacterium]